MSSGRHKYKKSTTAPKTGPRVIYPSGSSLSVRELEAQFLAPPPLKSMRVRYPKTSRIPELNKRLIVGHRQESIVADVRSGTHVTWINRSGDSGGQLRCRMSESVASPGTSKRSGGHDRKDHKPHFCSRCMPGKTLLTSSVHKGGTE
ncbi:hypothetical protein SRHO_G00201250 [Serrasalmus rhombeus]